MQFDWPDLPAARLFTRH